MGNYLSVSQWIKEGMKALYEEGPDALRIDRLRTRLGVTKGSFYHHFKNLDEYKRKLLDYYEVENTDKLIRLTNESDDIVEQFLRITSLSANLPKNPEVAIRAWAKKDPLARDYQKRIDAKRIEYLESLYSTILEEPEARLWAKLAYCLFIGTQQVVPPVGKKELRRIYDFMRNRMIEMMLSGDGVRGDYK